MKLNKYQHIRWKVYPQPYKILVPGTTRLIDHTEYLIGTEYDHPQLHAPAPVVGKGYSLDENGIRQTHIHLSKDHAELIAAAPLLLEALFTIRKHFPKKVLTEKMGKDYDIIETAINKALP